MTHATPSALQTAPAPEAPTPTLGSVRHGRPRSRNEALAALALFAIAGASCENGPSGVNIDPAVVELDVSVLTIEEHQVRTVEATVRSSDGSPIPAPTAGHPIVWMSSDTTVASVSTGGTLDVGVVAALAPGRATITASLGRAVSEISVDVSESRWSFTRIPTNGHGGEANAISEEGIVGGFYHGPDIWWTDTAFSWTESGGFHLLHTQRDWLRVISLAGRLAQGSSSDDFSVYSIGYIWTLDATGRALAVDSVVGFRGMNEHGRYLAFSDVRDAGGSVLAELRGPDGTPAIPTDINARGDVLGRAEGSSDVLLWPADDYGRSIRVTETAGGASMNDDGDVLTVDFQSGVNQLYLRQQDGWWSVELAAPDGASVVWARSVSRRRQDGTVWVVGSAREPAPVRPLLWVVSVLDATPRAEVSVLPVPRGRPGEARAVNSRGQVVGSAPLGPTRFGRDPVVWTLRE